MTKVGTGGWTNFSGWALGLTALVGWAGTAKLLCGMLRVGPGGGVGSAHLEAGLTVAPISPVAGSLTSRALRQNGHDTRNGFGGTYPHRPSHAGAIRLGTEGWT